jgi:hypothetical protein
MSNEQIFNKILLLMTEQNDRLADIRDVLLLQAKELTRDELNELRVRRHEGLEKVKVQLAAS